MLQLLELSSELGVTTGGGGMRFARGGAAPGAVAGADADAGPTPGGRIETGGRDRRDGRRPADGARASGTTGAAIAACTTDSCCEAIQTYNTSSQAVLQRSAIGWILVRLRLGTRTHRGTSNAAGVHEQASHRLQRRQQRIVIRWKRRPVWRRQPPHAACATGRDDKRPCCAIRENHRLR